MEKVTVTIITLNEEKNIERCLQSLRFADEIVVVDAFSSDGTLEICRKYTDKVFQEEWRGYGAQKNLCAAKAENRWILNIDADEVVSPACADEIREKLAAGDSHSVYCFPRKNYFGSRWVRFGGWFPDRISRLYDRERVSFSESRVHERLVPDVGRGNMNEAIEHYSFSGMEDYIARQNKYSTLFAEEKRQTGWQAGWSHLVLRPPFAFFKNYVLRQGFREGALGFFLALSSAFYTYLKYAKTREP